MEFSEGALLYTSCQEDFPVATRCEQSTLSRDATSSWQSATIGREQGEQALATNHKAPLPQAIMREVGQTVE